MNEELMTNILVNVGFWKVFLKSRARKEKIEDCSHFCMPLPNFDETCWAKDSLSTQCSLCSAPFTLVVRRHHCRGCGEIFCEKCCSNGLAPSVSAPQRVARRLCLSCISVCKKIGTQDCLSNGDSLVLFCLFSRTDAADSRVRIKQLLTRLHHLDSILCAEGRKGNLSSSSDGELASAIGIISSPTAARDTASMMTFTSNLRNILQRRSLTSFFVEFVKCVSDLLFTSLRGVLTRNSRMPLRPVAVDGAPSMECPSSLSSALLKLKLSKAECDALTVTPATTESVARACDVLENILESTVAAVTIRYSEQIACLTESSATLLAATASARLLHRFDRFAQGDDEVMRNLLVHVSFETVVFDALLQERPPWLQERPIATRLRDSKAEGNWTDNGVLSLCGLMTEDNTFFDTVVVNDESVEQSARATAARYFYRRGTRAEAMSLKMNPSGDVRHSQSPLWSAKALCDQHQNLTRRRDVILSTFWNASTQRVTRHDFDSWSLWLKGTREGTSPTTIQLTVVRETIRRCRDAIANPKFFWDAAQDRYSELLREHADIQVRLSDMETMTEDFFDAPLHSPDATALLAQVRSGGIDPFLVAQQNAFRLFGRHVTGTLESGNSPLTMLTRFYLHLRFQLLLVLLATSHSDLQDDPVTLLGQVLPFCPTISRVLETFYSRKSQQMSESKFTDCVERSCEAVSRVLTQRYSAVVEKLTLSSLVVFADCLAARWFHVFSTIPEQEVMTFIDSDPSKLVAHMENTDLVDTVVRMKKVYLSMEDSAGRLSEHGIIRKSALRAADGTIFVGTKETHDPPMHHRGVKYGVLAAFPSEIESKKLLQAAPDWSVTVVPKVKKSRLESLFKRSSDVSPRTIPPLLKSPPNESVIHFPSCMLSVGPRIVGPSEVVRTTFTARTRALQTAHASFQHLRWFVLSGGSGSGVLSSGDGDGIHTPSSSTVILTGATRSNTAGLLVVGVEHDGKVLVGNHVTVRSGPVDWPAKCSLDVTPIDVVMAGGLVRVIMTLRDAFGNVVSSSDSKDFTITVDNNDCRVMASGMTEVDEGCYAFCFTPTCEGPVSITVTAAGQDLTTSAPLRCIASHVDFKNSMFSFDEWEVEAGTVVTGNILLRDVYGNRVEADEHPYVQMINGGDELPLSVTRVHTGEYMFTFRPLRHGEAVIRASSSRTNVNVIARITVHAPRLVDWSHSTVSCLRKVIFAGEVAEFQIVPRDAFGNPVVTSRRFACSLQYVDGETHTNEERSIAAPDVEGTGSSFAFRVTPRTVGVVTALVTLTDDDGKTRSLESATLPVLPASLDWSSSMVSAPLTFVVGEWMTVRIDCRDLFGNATEASAADFQVAAWSAQAAPPSGPSTIQTKPICGSGSTFACFVMGTRTGPCTVGVSYGGGDMHVCEVVLQPKEPCWETCCLSLRDSGTEPSEHTVTAGLETVVELHFRDAFGNATQPLPLEDVEWDASRDGSAVPIVATALDASSAAVTVCPTVAGRTTVTARLRATGDAKVAHMGVVAAALHWPSTVLDVIQRASHVVAEPTAPLSMPSVTAGSAVTVRVRHFDCFGNPVTVASDAVSFRVVSSDVRGVTHVDVPVELRHIGGNEWAVTFVPELSGMTVLEAVLTQESESDNQSPIAKRVEVAVNPADIDFQSRSIVEVLDRNGGDSESAGEGALTIVAGQPFLLRLRLRDAFGNPVNIAFAEDPVRGRVPQIPDMCVAFEPPLHANCETWSVGEENVMTTICTLKVAGPTTVSVRDTLAGVDRCCRVLVHAAAASWERTRLKWLSPSTVAGVAAECSVLWHDAFDNETTSGIPPLEQVSLTTEWLVAAPIVVRAISGPLCADLGLSGTPPETIVNMVEGNTAVMCTCYRSGSFKVHLHFNDDPLASAIPSTELIVAPAAVSYNDSSLEIALVNEDEVLRSGQPVRAVLTLRDRYGNHAVGAIQNCELDLRVQVVGLRDPSHVACSVTPCTEGTTTTAASCHFLISFTPTNIGAYTISVGSRSESEAADLMLRVLVDAACVCWDADKTQLHSDVEAALAGSSVFFTLECRDTFGNPSAVGIESPDEDLVVSFRRQPWSTSLFGKCPSETDDANSSVGAADEVEMAMGDALSESMGVEVGHVSVLPQQPGMFGFSVEFRRSGSFAVSARLRSSVCGGAASCPEPLVILPAMPAWDQCTLVHCPVSSPTLHPVAGSPTWFGVILRDRYRNTLEPPPLTCCGIEPSQPVEPPLPSQPRNDSQDDLVDDLAAGSGVRSLVYAHRAAATWYQTLMEHVSHELLPACTITIYSSSPQPPSNDGDSAFKASPSLHHHHPLDPTVHHINMSGSWHETAQRIACHARLTDAEHSLPCVLLSCIPVVANEHVTAVVAMGDDHLMGALKVVTASHVVASDPSTVVVVDANANDHVIMEEHNVVTAGSTFERLLKVTDAYGNAVDVLHTDSEVVVQPAANVTSATVTAEGMVGSSSSSSRWVLRVVATKALDDAYRVTLRIRCSPPVEEAGARDVEGDVARRVTDIPATCFKVMPGPISADTSSVLCPVPSAVAGERVPFMLTPRDVFGNAVAIDAALQQLRFAPLKSPNAVADAAVSGTRVTAVNGRCRPVVCLAAMNHASSSSSSSSFDGVSIACEVTPEERGPLSIVLKDANGKEVVHSLLTSIGAAKLHWPSCVVKLTDSESIAWGSETSILIRGRDAFGNPVDIDSGLVAIRVCNGETHTFRVPNRFAPSHHADDAGPTSELVTAPDFAWVAEVNALPLLPECDGFHLASHKELICQLKAPYEGTLQCAVYCDGYQEPLLTNVVRIVGSDTSAGL